MTGQQPDPHPNYRCSSCGGSFNEWDHNATGLFTGTDVCPFCGIERRGYSGELKSHEQAIRGAVEWLKGLSKMLISLDESIDERIESALEEHEREYHSEDDDG